MDQYTQECLDDEEDLKRRVEEINKKFKTIYNSLPELVVRSPGRAEIIGNHTDYNHGYALSTAISNSTLALFKKNNTNSIRIFSNNFSTQEPVIFAINQKIAHDEKNTWSNYARGVVEELQKKNIITVGADVLIDSNIPMGAGVSSSAAYELAICLGLLKVSGQALSELEMALLCQKAENLYVKSPCGFLDQGSIMFGKHGQLVFMDFLPQDGNPVTKVENVTTRLSDSGGSFVVAVDKTAKRELGTSGYPARRKMCEDGLPFWSKVLNKEVESLRFVTPIEFEQHKAELEKISPEMGKRAEHIIYENERVLKAIEALKNDDVSLFGKLLTEAGESALFLYELAQDTPELLFLFEEGKKMPGVLGIRNMGGGFSATVLALVKKEQLGEFKKNLSNLYKNKFNSNLDFIEFNLTNGVGVLKTN